jgi:hypothetical protein
MIVIGRRKMPKQEVTCLIRDRPVRALSSEGQDGRTHWTFVQPHLFYLRPALLMPPERLTTNADLDSLIRPQPEYAQYELWKLIGNPSGIWRTREYAFYRKGIEYNTSLEFGNSIVWGEERGPGKKPFMAKLDFGKWAKASVPFSVNGRPVTTSLEKACGLGIVDIDKLEMVVDFGPERTAFAPSKDVEYCEIRFKPDFNPQTDLKIIDIMRPPNYALPDAKGFPLMGHETLPNAPEGRCPCFLPASKFTSFSNGYHGSIARSIRRDDTSDQGKLIIACLSWRFGAGVAAVDYTVRKEEVRELLEMARRLGGPDTLEHLAKVAEYAVKTAEPIMRWAAANAPLLRELAEGLKLLEGPPKIAP